MNKITRSRTAQEARNSTSNIQDIITLDSFINKILRKGSGSNSAQHIIQIEEEIDVDKKYEFI